jgi:hypothetical protein
MYQVGQAVIVYGNTLAIINHKHTQGMYGLKPLIGNNVFPDKHESEIRPATVDEILAEIQKHGWKTQVDYIDSPTGWIRLYDTNTDPCHIWSNPQDAEEMEALGKELITLSRIEKALKICNEKPV